MNLHEAREFVRQFCNDAEDDSRFNAAEVDRAIQYAGNQFCRLTRILKAKNDILLVSGNSAVDLAVPVAAGFTAEKAIAAFIVGQARPLSLVGWGDINTSIAAEPTTATPVAMGFVTDTTAELWPTPDSGYTLRLMWWKDFTSWTAGQDDEELALNIPDVHLPVVLADGAASVLRFPNPKDRAAATGWQRFEAYTARQKGAGNLGARAVYRNPLE